MAIRNGKSYYSFSPVGFVRKKNSYLLFFSLVIIIITFSCQKEKTPDIDNQDLSEIPFSPQEYKLETSSNYPEMNIPSDNTLTVEGISLGRSLFYDPIMSIDSTISCSSCHIHERGFKDNSALSTGIDGRVGRRSSMSLLNVGYNRSNLFWDGRQPDLESQITAPVEDPNELGHNWPALLDKLQNHHEYPVKFRKAFGIIKSTDINEALVSKAIAQFERTLVSSGNSRYDRILRGEASFTDDELQGYLMFFDVVPDLPDAECGHCHTEPFFTTFEFKNNGIEAVENLTDFIDKGRGEVTGEVLDNGKFKIPTLINVFETAPYMHDGRFSTMEEVMEHYNSGGHRQLNTDPLIRPLGLSNREVEQVLAFIKTLTDSSFLKNPDYSKP